MSLEELVYIFGMERFERRTYVRIERIKYVYIQYRVLKNAS